MPSRTERPKREIVPVFLAPYPHAIISSEKLPHNFKLTFEYIWSRPIRPKHFLDPNRVGAIFVFSFPLPNIVLSLFQILHRHIGVLSYILSLR
jgi:hypothetical protein